MSSIQQTIQRVAAPLEPIQAKLKPVQLFLTGRPLAAVKPIVVPAIIIAAATVFCSRGLQVANRLHLLLHAPQSAQQCD